MSNQYKSITENEADISVCGVTCFDDGKDGIFFGTIMPQMEGDKLTVTKELLKSDFYQISCDLLLTDSRNKMYRTQFARDTNIKYELPNISFLKNNAGNIKKLKGFDRFKLSSFSLPVFMLGNVLWLDAFSLIYRFVQNLKIRLRERKNKASKRFILLPGLEYMI